MIDGVDHELDTPKGGWSEILPVNYLAVQLLSLLENSQP